LNRPEQLRQEYESTSRAAHYRDDRWTRSARARRTNALELSIVDEFVTRCRRQQSGHVAGAAPRFESALDLPCGTGRFRELLESHVTSLLSADASFEMLAAAPSSPQLQASAHALPLVDDAVEFVLCSRLVHHFETSAERQVVLRELSRVSRRWLVLSYFDRANFQAWRSLLRGKLRGRFPISRSRFQDDINAAGLREVERRYIRRGISEQVWVLLEVKQ